MVVVVVVEVEHGCSGRIVVEVEEGGGGGSGGDGGMMVFLVIVAVVATIEWLCGWIMDGWSWGGGSGEMVVAP